MKWPNDVDGDVFRRLEEHNFDFTKEYEIDFNIDFDYWPPTEEAIVEIKKYYPQTKVYPPDQEDFKNGNDIGYLQFQVTAKVTYDLVMKIQEEITALMKKHGGWCESWGVMND